MPGTDAQVKLWRDVKRRRLLVAFRGTEWWKVRDIIVDLKLLQEPWDVRALHQRGDSAGGGASASTGGGAVQAAAGAVQAPAEAAAVGGAGEVEQQGEGGSSSSVVDIYTALAAQANRTMLLYNELDQDMKVSSG